MSGKNINFEDKNFSFSCMLIFTNIHQFLIKKLLYELLFSCIHKNDVSSH